MDNEVSKAIQQAIEKQGAKFQIVEHANYCVNAAIHTFKDHFIAGLASTIPEFPLYLWDYLLE